MSPAVSVFPGYISREVYGSPIVFCAGDHSVANILMFIVKSCDADFAMRSSEM